MTEPASIASIIGGLLRVVAAMLGLKKVPKKNLRSKILKTGIIAELPRNFPLKIVDENGGQHCGVYGMKVLVQNLGTEMITPADFMEAAPFRIVLSNDAYIIKADAFSDSRELEYNVEQLDDQTVTVTFDGINPTEYLSLMIWYGGEALPQVQIRGRIRGQATSLDHDAVDTNASWGERITCAVLLVMIANMFFGTPASGAFIYYQYGAQEFLKMRPEIPAYLSLSFGMRASFIVLFLWSRITAYLERRKYPPGYPSQWDFEPPLWQNVKYMASTAFLGDKHRFSNSLFSWAKPVKPRGSNMRRTKRDDWKD